MTGIVVCITLYLTVTLQSVTQAEQPLAVITKIRGFVVTLLIIASARDASTTEMWLSGEWKVCVVWVTYRYNKI